MKSQAAGECYAPYFSSFISGQLQSDKFQQLAGINYLRALPALREVMLVAGHKIVYLTLFGAFQKSVVSFIR